MSRAKKRTRTTERLADVEIADRFIAKHSDTFRHCGPRGGWFFWDGQRWTLDVEERHREAIKDLGRDLLTEACALVCMDRTKDAFRVMSANGLAGIAAVARSDRRIVVGASRFDCDPWLLTCANGTVDLRTGELNPHDPKDLITKCSPVVYDPNARAPRFEAFLQEVQKDPDVRAYLARLFGCAAVGEIRDHVFAVLWGPGANGKSVLAECVLHALGEYAGPAPGTLITQEGKSDPHPTDMASLLGKRLAVVHETKRGAKFNAARVKLLTGGDTITARFMRGDFFDFDPTHTLLMLSNYKPEADATDGGLWRRIQLVPFNVTIPEERRDTTLAETIKREESAGVLRWLVEGARSWAEQGLNPPSAIRSETEAYQMDEASVVPFIEECCERGEGKRQRGGELYDAYKVWCADVGKRYVSNKDFAAELRGLGFDKGKSMGRVVYRGLALQAEVQGTLPGAA